MGGEGEREEVSKGRRGREGGRRGREREEVSKGGRGRDGGREGEMIEQRSMLHRVLTLNGFLHLCIGPTRLH